MTGLQFDVQQKIKLILGESNFRASGSSVVTLTPRNYVSSLILGNVPKYFILVYFSSKYIRDCSKVLFIFRPFKTMKQASRSFFIVCNCRAR